MGTGKWVRRGTLAVAGILGTCYLAGTGSLWWLVLLPGQLDLLRRAWIATRPR
jgi:hypothetical protein